MKKNSKGYLIDKLARKSLQNVGLDYSHGTGHGVGFFLNVHEGPQAISKFNKVKLKEGMILSNEPGYYLKNKYGEWIVYEPELNQNTFLLWSIPLILFAFGGLLIIRKVSIK